MKKFQKLEQKCLQRIEEVERKLGRKPTGFEVYISPKPCDRQRDEKTGRLKKGPLDYPLHVLHNMSTREACTTLSEFEDKKAVESLILQIIEYVYPVKKEEK